MKKYIDDFTVIKNERLNDDAVILTLKHPGTLPDVLPGQFVEVKVDHAPNTFLRRPISIHDIDQDQNIMKLLVMLVGEGTQTMGELKEGETLNLVYPLGNGFTIPKEKKQILLIGGGCGTAPLLYMGRCLKACGIEPRFLLGARSRDGLLALDEFEKVGTVYTTTEDGSHGTKGFVVHHPVMATDNPEIDMICTCGPEVMMKAVATYAKEHGIKCEVSLENTMACGVGACLCCVVDTVDGHICTCTEGPVFDAEVLKW